jgi:CRISPR-associated protein Cas1
VSHAPLLRVAALHALAYCERLFYLEEVEELRLADAAVYGGRALHAVLDREEGALEKRTLESERLGLKGVVDVLRRRDGTCIPYEHKRGRSRAEASGPEAWETDRIQIAAYAVLLEEALGQPVAEGRVRYHGDGHTVRVGIDDPLRKRLQDAIARAHQLRESLERPPVTTNERLCIRCSLAPACLPEEERLALDEDWEPVRLFPPDDERRTVHVVSPGARVGRKGDTLAIEGDQAHETIPVSEVGQLVLHGFAQISTQAIRLCVDREVGVHWVTGGGRYIGALAAGAGMVQRRLRQYAALSDEARCLGFAQRLVLAKAESQLRFLLRATRGAPRRPEVQAAVSRIRALLPKAARAPSRETLLGFEGAAASAYFEALPALFDGSLPEGLRFDGRNRRPPRDRANAIMSFGYGQLYRTAVQAALSVGLDPAIGFYHQPRSARYPLALDLVELFRVALWDMPLVASINRGQWDPDADFVRGPGHVWLSDAGREKAIELYERRLADQWKHPVVGYSLSYARLVELEARLLEKEWTGPGGLFARMRLR